jgi:hypothetical protein
VEESKFEERKKERRKKRRSLKKERKKEGRVGVFRRSRRWKKEFSEGV